MLLFLTHFEVNLEQQKLKPDMAQINYNVLNETTWINIVRTFMGNFVTTVIAKSMQRHWNTWYMTLVL